MRSIEETIDYRFKNTGILKEALTHKSHASEHRDERHNERLEFLGDSVLGTVTAEYVYLALPDEGEGRLSKLKSYLVSKPVLADWGRELGIGDYLFLGAGEEASGGRFRQSLLANAVEALLGAVYLDGGFEAAARVIRGWLREQSIHADAGDYKSRLQEILQKKYGAIPEYDTARTTGPEHDKTFVVTVRRGMKVLGIGSGKNKKEAQQSAARDAMEKVEKDDGLRTD